MTLSLPFAVVVSDDSQIEGYRVEQVWSSISVADFNLAQSSSPGELSSTSLTPEMLGTLTPLDEYWNWPSPFLKSSIPIQKFGEEWIDLAFVHSAETLCEVFGSASIPSIDPNFVLQ